jgi:type IV pilus assembly protein PilB
METYKNEDLYNAIKKLELLPEDVVEDVLKQAEQQTKKLHQIILERDLMSDKNLGLVIADLLNFPFIDLNTEQIDESILNVIPQVVAKKNSVILFGHDDNGYKLATFNPNNQEVIKFIQKKVGDDVKVYFATERNIEEAMHLYDKDIKIRLEKLFQTHTDVQNPEEPDAPISVIVDTIIQFGIQNKSSDIHIEPHEDYAVIRFRIDGVLHDILDYPKKLHDNVITRIKILSKMRTDEHMSAQDGRIELNLDIDKVDIRVSVIPTKDGEKAVLRLLASKSREYSLQDLGILDHDLEKVTRAYQNTYGMILATGPTGSGKTTTIYAVLKMLNTREKNIATIEDPIEYDIEGINQIQVNPKTNLTFAEGLRAVLRQDPDIIFVGEIRDHETAGIAVNSAMTGHLVLSTLHTNNAASTLPRLIDMNIEPFLIASTVNVIIAQRLVRRICEKCKVSFEQPPGELFEKYPIEMTDKLFAFENREENIRLYKGKGCEICHDSGFTGRVGIFEVLEVTPEIKELIVNKADSDTIMRKAVEQGMHTMLDDGVQKVKLGVTTMDELFRVMNN